MKRQRLKASVLCSLILACGSDNRGVPEVRQDTTTVEVTGDADPIWLPGAGWEVAPEPTLSIGLENSSAELRFNRIQSMFTLPDGTLLVANGGPPPEIRVFDAAGEPVAVFGGAGEGPGEFRSLRGAWFITPDSILTLDVGLRRTTLFDRQGEVLRTDNLGRLLEGGFVVLGRFSDGSWLLGENVPVTVERDGQRRVRRILARSRIGSARTDTLIGFYEALKVLDGLEWEIPLFYPGVGTYIAHGDRIYAGYPNEFAIDVFKSDGTRLQQIRRQVTRRSVTNDVFDRLAAARLATPSIISRPDIEKQLASRDRPEVLPAFGSNFVVDVEDHLWVQGFVVPGDEKVQWSIFDSTGRYLGQVELPSAFVPVEIGTDRIAGIWRDSLDVETVRVYDLDRGDTR